MSRQHVIDQDKCEVSEGQVYNRAFPAVKECAVLAWISFYSVGDGKTGFLRTSPLDLGNGNAVYLNGVHRGY